VLCAVVLFIFMVKCPSCKEDFGTTPMTEKMNIEELSKDSVIVYCPFCDVFLGIENGKRK
jgi:transposase-like protein